MINSKLEDSTLLTLYTKGDDRAFEILLDRHKNRIFTSIYLIVKDTYIAEDIMQESFIKAIKTIKQKKYNEEGKFLPWILRIAHNLSVDYFRKSKRYPVIVSEDGNDIFNTLEFSTSTIEDEQIIADTHNQLKWYIKDLPDNQREVLMMRHYMKMSFQDIAESTNVSINTALGRMRYALLNLKKKFQQKQQVYD